MPPFHPQRMFQRSPTALERNPVLALAPGEEEEEDEETSICVMGPRDS